MTALWLLLIPYTSLAYGIHGGEALTGTPRIIRNILCALPFGLVAYAFAVSFPHGLFHTRLDDCLCVFAAFLSAYLGANMGFDNHPLWLKGLINFFPFGAALLPIAYANKNMTAAQCEYLSGALYGICLAALAISFYM